MSDGQLASAGDPALLQFLDGLECIAYATDIESLRVLWANRAAREAVGRDPTGEVCYEALWGHTERCDFCTSAATLEGTSAHPRTYCATGRHYRVKAQPASWPDGHTVRVSLAFDVTEQVKAEADLRDTRDYLESLLRYANAPVIVWDPDLVITRFNPAFEVLTGIPADQAIGSRLEVLFPPESRASSMVLIQRAVAGEQWQVVEIPVQHRSGETHVVLWNSANVLAADGETVVATIAQGYDITERKRAEGLRESEERLRTIFAEVPSGIALIDSVSGRIYEANPMFASIAGRAVEELTTRDWMSITHPDDVQAELDNMALLNAGKIASFQMDKRYIRPDGSIVWISMTIAPLRSGDPSQRRHLCGIHDITERKRVEEEKARLETQRKLVAAELAKQAEELQRSNLSLQQFAYVASHDLQEPLRTVNSFATLLRERYRGQLDETADQYIDFLTAGATRMQALINDLLAFSRIQISGEKLKPADAHAALGLALANLRQAVEESGAVVTCDALPTVAADVMQLAQVFQDLIGNAIKFGGEGPPHVHVSAVEEDGEWVFSVRDSGIGIDPKYHDRVFIMFQRLHGTRDYPGTGIGLAVAKRIVERHGGRIWFDSEPGKGATFRFTLTKREDTAQ